MSLATLRDWSPSTRRGRAIAVAMLAVALGVAATAGAADPPGASASAAAPASAVAPEAAASAAPVAPAAPPAAPAAPPAGAAADAAEEPSPQALMFAKKCGSCHTLGDGDRTGPDLLGATKRREPKWLATFIRGPGAAIDGGDPVANELLGKFKGTRMPDQSVTDEELAGLLGYVTECTRKGGCKLAFGKVKAAREATPADIAGGRALFQGDVALANGGAPCMSCHNVRGVGLVGGGSLAKDLTLAFARLGEQGTTAALASTPFPLMKNIYGEHPLRDAEAFKLKAFLYDSARDGTAPSLDHTFFYLGVLGTIAAFAAIGAGWQNRLRGVRQRIVRRGYR